MALLALVALGASYVLATLGPTQLPAGQALPFASDLVVADPGSLAWAAPGELGLAGRLERPQASEPVAPLSPARVNDADPPAVTAQYIAILDGESGALLYGQGPHARVPPASTTKIATTLVALQGEPDLGRVIPITIDGLEMAAQDGSQVMGIEPGEQLRLETLLYGMMLWSGNDAAEQVALALGDNSRERYVGWMNELVASLGLENTRFANPSGMDANGHYSSAADMAQLARAAMRDDTFRRLAETRSLDLEGYRLVNLNRLLGSYAGADGVKIGYTDEAGRTMVASATRDGHRVYVSVMRSEDLVGDTTALFDWVWRTFRWPAGPAGRAPIADGISS